MIVLLTSITWAEAQGINDSFCVFKYHNSHKTDNSLVSVCYFI